MPRAENITPSILAWARETAGLSVEDAAAQLGLTSSTRGTAAEKLEAFERGDVKPTRKQLLKIAATYRRPLTVFYRETPPILGHRGEDFRATARSVSNREAALLDTLLRDIHVRQDMVKSILEDDEDIHSLDFVNSINVEQEITNAVQTIRWRLGIDDDHDFGINLKSPRDLFNKLREKVEGIDVFVLLVGNLGSHHTNVSEQVFRGFAIADDIAPFIVINDQDATPARLFTLIHELTHIFAGSTGVSDAPSTVMSDTLPARVERFCNDVAGEFLLPEDSIQNIGSLATFDTVAKVIRKVATSRNISEAMVAYRFWRTDRIDGSVYNKLVKWYTERWQKTKDKQRELSREESSSSPSYYTVRKHRLGNALIDLVGHALRSNELTHTKAAKMLGVKPSSVEPLLREVETISGSYSRKRG